MIELDFFVSMKRVSCCFSGNVVFQKVELAPLRILCKVTLRKADLQIQTKAAKLISPPLCADRRQRLRTPWCFLRPRKKHWSASSR